MDNKYDNPISRRNVIKVVGGLLGLSLANASHGALESTPMQTMGPFYPVSRPLDSDMDLTRIKGKSGRAMGQVIEVSGRVLNTKGKAVSHAKVKIWQANTHGRYDHAGDISTAPLDPNFQGFAEQVTDEQGRYRFRTVKPGAYSINPINQDNIRPPHIHFDIMGKVDRLVTQMYFPDEPLNQGDIIYKELGEEQNNVVAKRLANTDDMEKDSLHFQWDIILSNG